MREASSWPAAHAGLGRLPRVGAQRDAEEYVALAKAVAVRLAHAEQRREARGDAGLFQHLALRGRDEVLACLC